MYWQKNENLWKVIIQNPLFFLLISTAYIGPGISYDKLYLFHVFFSFSVIYVLLNIYRQKIKLPSKQDLIQGFPIFLFFGIVLLTSIFGNLNLNYLFYYAHAFAFFLVLFLGFRDLIANHFKSILLFLLILVGIESLIGFLEVLSDFRYPISVYSYLNEFFGRENFTTKGWECYDLQYGLSSPTGFHWNQNDFAFALILGLSFSSFISSVQLRSLFRILILFLILSAGSRLGFYIATITLLLLLFNEIKKLSFWSILPLLFLIIVYTDGFYYFPIQSKKVYEVSIISKSTFPRTYSAECVKKLSEDLNSSDTRKTITLLGLQKFKENNFFGQGAGSFSKILFEHVKEQKNSVRNVTTYSPHNFILELLFDFGIILLVPFCWLIFIMYRKLKRIDIYAKNSIRVFFITLFPATAMQSSLVYCLPFYLFLYLTVLFVLAKKQNEENIPIY